MLRDALRPAAGRRLYEPVLDLVGNARFVLIGEASHGTDEFYRIRAGITKRLITERGFNAVAVEADWPDAYRANLYARGRSDDANAEEALRGFRRFPAWMWRNVVVEEFIEWLRSHNQSLAAGHAGVGFYGLDLYSMYASMEAVVSYLDRVDPQAAARARARYGCFEWVARDAQRYGYTASVGGKESCEDDVVAQLLELQRSAPVYANLDGRAAEEEAFATEQNARLAVNAERYYREMYLGGASSWNLRDTHMVDTLGALVSFLEQRSPAKVVVWAHNSHLGDARATQMGWTGEINVGQLVRERWSGESCLIGFTTFTGTVTASSDWGGPAELKRVRPGMGGSYERHFHETGEDQFFIDLRDGENVEELHERRLERAIGVIYRPETELASHYFHAVLPQQFDAVIHIDETNALQPLERWSILEEEPPETYPWAV